MRSMIEELRQFNEQHRPLGTGGRFRAGVTTRLAPLPAWKRAADFLFVQVSFDIDALAEWRTGIDFDGPVYAGVMVLPSASRAEKLAADIPEITIPRPWIDSLDADPSAGVHQAVALAQDIERTGLFAGVHLIPGVRYRKTAAHIERMQPKSPKLRP